MTNININQSHRGSRKITAGNNGEIILTCGWGKNFLARGKVLGRRNVESDEGGGIRKNKTSSSAEMHSAGR